MPPFKLSPLRSAAEAGGVWRYNHMKDDLSDFTQSGDTTPCRMIGVTLHSRGGAVLYERGTPVSGRARLGRERKPFM